MPIEAPKFDLPHLMAGGALIAGVVGGGYSGIQSNDMHKLESTMVTQAKVAATQEQVIQRVDDLERRLGALAQVVEGLKR